MFNSHRIWLLLSCLLIVFLSIGLAGYTPIKAHKIFNGTDLNNDGEELYLTRCQSCHLADGSGVPGVFPPVNSSNKIVTRDKGRLIRGILGGLSGELEVDGVTYNGIQPPWGGSLSDEQISSLLTYLRNSFDNRASTVTRADVSCVREKTMDRAEIWTVEELEEVKHRGMPLSSYVKVINNSSLFSKLELMIQDSLFVESLAFNQASSITGFCTDPYEVVIKGYRVDGSMEVLLDTTLNPLDEDTFVFVASDLTANSSVIPELVQLKKSTPFSSSKDSVDVALFHGYSDVSSAIARVYSIRDSYEQLLFTTTLSFNEFTPIETIGSTEILIELINADLNVQIGAYAFDLNEYSGETVSIVVGGQTTIEMRAYPGYESATGVPVSTRVEDELDNLSEVSPVQIAPNPFTSTTGIRFSLSSQELVRLDIYDILGRRVHTLVDEVLSMGSYSFVWDASGIPSGIYLYRLQSGTRIEKGKMLLVR